MRAPLRASTTISDALRRAGSHHPLAPRSHTCSQSFSRQLPTMFAKPRDPAAARRELTRNATLFVVAVLAIRGSTYLMDALQKHA